MRGLLSWLREGRCSAHSLSVVVSSRYSVDKVVRRHVHHRYCTLFGNNEICAASGSPGSFRLQIAVLPPGKMMKRLTHNLVKILLRIGVRRPRGACRRRIHPSRAWRPNACRARRRWRLRRHGDVESVAIGCFDEVMERRAQTSRQSARAEVSSEVERRCSDLRVRAAENATLGTQHVLQTSMRKQ